MKLYHATFNAYVDSIMKSGLQGGLSKNYPDSEPHLVYLATDMETAISFCEIAEPADDIYDSGICCFEVTLDEASRAKLIYDPNIIDSDIYKCYYAYPGTIPPELLKLCKEE